MKKKSVLYKLCTLFMEERVRYFQSCEEFNLPSFNTRRKCQKELSEGIMTKRTFLVALMLFSFVLSTIILPTRVLAAASNEPFVPTL